MKLAFLLEVPNIRGSTVASYDYAHFAETLLNHECFFVCNRSKKELMHPLGVERLQSRFPIEWIDDLGELDSVLSRQKADFMYTLRTGHAEPWIPTVCPTGVHVMFQHYQPYGTTYAYISEWLSVLAKEHLGVDVPYVPHMVHGPTTPIVDIRAHLGIPKEAIVFGRYGGFEQFDIKLAQRAIIGAVRRRKDIYFLMMNTQPFETHPQIIYVPPQTGLQEKCDFIHACDAMIHARRRGESFGMSIAEFLHQGKPVICWFTGNDKNHVHMLGNQGIYYRTMEDLITIFMQFRPEMFPAERYKNIAAQFLPEPVMARFERVFLQRN